MLRFVNFLPSLYLTETSTTQTPLNSLIGVIRCLIEMIMFGSIEFCVFIIFAMNKNVYLKICHFCDERQRKLHEVKVLKMMNEIHETKMQNANSNSGDEPQSTNQTV